MKRGAHYFYLQVLCFAGVARLGAVALQLALPGKLRDAADGSLHVTQELHAPVQEQHAAVAAQLDVRLPQTHQALHDLRQETGNQD